MLELKVDPEFKTLLTPLSQHDYEELEKSILQVGCEMPLAVWNGTLVDGHNRYEICQRHGIDFKTIEKNFDSRNDAKIWIVQRQFLRRNLNLYLRAKLALILKPMIKKRAKDKQLSTLKKGNVPVSQNSVERGTPIDTQKELAMLAGVSHDTIAKVEIIEEEATDEQIADLINGTASINEVYKKIRSKLRRKNRVQMLLELSEEPAPELNSVGKFPVLYADPPWHYEHSVSDSRVIENQYPTMSLDDIKEMDIEAVCTETCILFMWATSPKLTEAMEVIDAWGFNYRTCMVWVKDKIGMGYYARQRHELLLIATKGDMPTPEPADRPDSVIEAPRDEHSAKPERVYDLIEQMYPELPKLELFARRQRESWSSWGNQSE